MPIPSFDVLVIGGGINGLGCAARLAGAGRRVMLVEAAARVGGGAGTREIAPGFHAPALAHLTQGIDPRLAAELDLEGHGLAFHPPLRSTVLSATGDHLVVAQDRAAGPDTAAWAALHGKLAGFAHALAPFRRITPPRLAGRQRWLPIAREALGLRALGRAGLRELLRMILINVHDVAEDELTDDRLKGLLAFDATLGAWLGPRSPNSLILYLDRLARGPAPLLPRGGMGALAATLGRAAEAKGVEIRTGARAMRLLIEGDRAVGLRLEDGEELRAAQVVSAINPRTTFRDLVGAAALDAGFFAATRHIRSRGGAAKLDLALHATPDFRGADLATRLVIAPSSEAVEAAFNPAKYGEVPEAPVMEAILPSVYEPGHAPVGAHLLSAIVQHAPPVAAEGLAPARAKMLEAALAMLEAQAPGLRNLVVHAELLMPQDIEARFGMVGGNWHHGELCVEQMLFNRPLFGAAQYATPLPGLWLAGAGSHPGGGIDGAAGWNAAGALMEAA